MVRRDKLVRMYNIITACFDPIKATNIQRLVGLNYSDFKPMLENALEKGFIKVYERESDTKKIQPYYITTLSGHKLVKEIRALYDKVSGER